MTFGQSKPRLAMLSVLLLLLCHSATPQPCPPGFNRTLGRCLLFNLIANVTWCDANRACADLGAELLTNWTVIQSLSSVTFHKDAWIGVSDLANERDKAMDGWQFVNGRGIMPNSSFVWRAGDPNNKDQRQDCVMMRFNFSDSGLMDKECNYTSGIGFICEVADVSVTRPTCHGIIPGGIDGGRIRWTRAPSPPSTSTAGVPNDLNLYCYQELPNVFTMRDCAVAAAFWVYSRSFLYSKQLRLCHVIEFSDSQTQLEQDVTAWVKYVKDPSVFIQLSGG